MKRISLAALLSVFVPTTHASETDVDAALMVYFPDRDLSKSPVKIVDYRHNMYVVGDSFEILKDGRVRTTNAVVLIKLIEPNRDPRYSTNDAPRMVLTFEKPVRSIADLQGNRLKSYVGFEHDDPNNRTD